MICGELEVVEELSVTLDGFSVTVKPGDVFAVSETVPVNPLTADTVTGLE